MNGSDCCRFNVWALAFALGVTWALGIFILGLGAFWFGWGTALVGSFGSIYIGYAPTLVGSFLGLIWGFFDGFIAGLVLAWLYNCFNRCFGGVCKPKQ